MNIIHVLDRGFVELVATLGDELTIVNSARVSFGKRKEILEQDDRQLMRYLVTHKHFSPFRHAMMQFHVKAPDFVTRQWYKHVVGIETTASSAMKDHAWNEISGRYVPITEFHIPAVWRSAPENKKQGSGGGLSDSVQTVCAQIAERGMSEARATYELLLAQGVCHEQARMFLPINFYTEFYWTASFQAIMHFIELRNESHAQWEIQEYARAIESFARAKFPFVSSLWLDKDGEGYA